jgi:hypothetical protein
MKRKSTSKSTSSSRAAPRTKAAKESKMHKVMHEYKAGELKSGKAGKGGKVKSRKQAVAIAMHESGQSWNHSAH